MVTGAEFVESSLLAYKEDRQAYVRAIARMQVDRTAPYPSYSQLEAAWMAVGKTVLEALGLPTAVTPDEIAKAIQEILEAKWSQMRLAPPALRDIILERDGFQCRQCGSTRHPLHVDHVVPWALGGLTTRGNLQALCAECNLKKGAGPL